MVFQNLYHLVDVVPKAARQRDSNGHSLTVPYLKIKYELCKWNVNVHQNSKYIYIQSILVNLSFIACASISSVDRHHSSSSEQIYETRDFYQTLTTAFNETFPNLDLRRLTPLSFLVNTKYVLNTINCEIHLRTNAPKQRRKFFK